MNDIKIRNLVFSMLSCIPLDDTHKKTIATNPSVINPLFELPVNFIHWSFRVKCVFENNNIKKIRDLLNILEELNQFSSRYGKGNWRIKLRNFGVGSYKEVIKKLGKFFKQYLDSEHYRAAVNQLVDRLNKGSSNINSVIKRGILGEIFNDRISSFYKILLDDEKIDKLLNTPVYMVDFSVRSLNVLKYAAGVKFIKDLGRFNSKDLLRYRNFGRKSLKDIRIKLKDLIEEIEKPQKLPGSLGLEELVKIILSKLPKRQKAIIHRRYGLWNGKKETLEEISKRFGLTRERIRQIQNKQIQRIQRSYKDNIYLKVCLESFFNNKLRPFMEKNYNIASQSELLEVIYSIDGEKIGIDVANEFLCDAIFDGSPIFSAFVIKFDNEVVGLYEDDRKFYLKLIESTLMHLRNEKIPQSIDKLMQYFEDIKLIQDKFQDRSRVERFLLVSNIARDISGKFGLAKWRYFNAKDIVGMAERALMEINKPAHFTQIVLLMNEMYPQYGLFDVHSVHGRIGSRKDIFIWVSPGVYGLKLWGLERPPYIKDYLVELLKENNRPVHLNELAEKVLERCNCSIHSVSMTLDFNRDVFIQYPDKLYGLIKWK